MNTIEEILRSKNVFEKYVELIGHDCENRYNEKDLCKITRRIDNTVKCDNYSRCIENKCNTCSEVKKCFKNDIYVTAKRYKTIMKRINK